MKRDMIFLLIAIAVIATLKFVRLHQGDGEELQKGADVMAWQALIQTHTTLDTRQGTYSATYPEAVNTLVGKTLRISGYMSPLEPAIKSKHFLLTRRAPTCPFCPPGEPNEIIEIFAREPVAWTYDRAVLSGKFELMNNPQAGLFFKLSDATLQP